MGTTDRKNTTEYSAKGVRERLLDVAEGLFAERGFEGTSIRELASAADSNIASVNYYFGGKEKRFFAGTCFR